MDNRKNNIKFDDLEKKISDLDKTMVDNYNELNTKNIQNSNQIQSNSQNINEIKTQIQTVKQKTNEVETKTNSFESSINNIQAQFDNFETEKTELNSQISSLGEKVDEVILNESEQNAKIDSKVDKTTTINGKELSGTGIQLSASDIGLSNVDNTSDLNKPISTATQNALDLKANQTDLEIVSKTATDAYNAAAVNGANIHALQMQDETHTSLINSLTSSLNDKVEQSYYNVQIKDINDRIGYQNEDIETLTEDVLALQTKTNTNTQNISTNTSDISNIKSSLQTFSGVLDSYSTMLESVSDTASDNTDKINEIDSFASELESRIVENTNAITQIGSDIDGIKLKNTQQDGKFDQIMLTDIPNLSEDVETIKSNYITKDVNNLTNYTKSSSLAKVATSGSYNDLTNKPTIPDGAVIYQGTGQNTDGAMSQKATTDSLNTLTETVVNKANVDGTNITYPSIWQTALGVDNKANKDLSNVSSPALTVGSATSGSGDRVVSNYISSDGNTWYRIWKSGWKECGGLVTFSGSAWQTPVITFPLTFTAVKTINFNIIRQSGYDGNFYGFIYDYSNTQFRATTYVISGTQNKAFYYACGY